MEQNNNTLGMLDLMVRPGFCVRNYKIIKVNQAARGLLLEPGMDIRDMLATGREEYAQYSDGCLYLTLNLSGREFGASVNRMEECDVFLLDEEDNVPLRAMSLAARELREPLTAVMTTADRLFPLSAEAEDSDLKEQVARLNRGLYRMLRVVSNMSDAELYGASPISRQETVEIRGFFQEVFDRSRELIAHSGLELRFENLNQPLYCLADLEKLERAVLNILSNAVKFTPGGGYICARLVRRDSRLQLTIQDSGEGIHPSLRGSIHSRYLRQPGIEDPRHGIGLGMVLIRSAAACHGGTVLIDHPEETGTRITMTLAIRQNPNPEVRSRVLRVDYAGERDHGLMELSGSLPASLYESDKIK